MARSFGIRHSGIRHLLGYAFQEASHLNGGFGAFGAFVADFAAGALDGLIHCFTGEYAEQHGDVRAKGDLRNGSAHGAVDVLIVRCFAADYGAETDYGGVAIGCGKPLGDKRDFHGAWNPGDVDRIGGDALLFQLGDGAVEKFARDRFVPAGDDDGEVSSGGKRGGSNNIRHVNR